MSDRIHPAPRRHDTRRGERTVPEAELAAAIDGVRELAARLGGPEHLSLAKIRRSGIGGSTRYLMNLRDTVRAEVDGRPQEPTQKETGPHG